MSENSENANQSVPDLSVCFIRQCFEEKLRKVEMNQGLFDNTKISVDRLID